MRPNRDETCMAIAVVMAERSTCSRLHVGAVIARDGRVLSTGYNGAPASMPHCRHDCNCSTWAVSGKVSHAANCDSVASCKIAVHAEANAVAFAARHQVSTEGGTLYSTHSPCLPCAQLLINCGLREVIFGTKFRDESGLELLISAGLLVAHFGSKV